MVHVTKKPSEEKAATPLSILEQIFGEALILQNQSQFTSKEGKVDFSKLKDFLTKQGYSEKFASEVAEGLRKGTLTLKDTLKYSQAAKNDLDLKNRYLYGKPDQIFAIF